MKFLSLDDGGRLAYEVTGAGEPVLLIMGTGADHVFWMAQVAPLARHYRVITFDSRGTGESSDFRRIEDCTPASLGSDAVALLDHVAEAPAHVVGLSLGSVAAQELALARPEMLLSLGLHGTWGRSDEWFVRMVETMETSLQQGGLEAFIRGATCWIVSPDFHAAHPDIVAGMEAGYLARRAARVNGVLAHCHADRVHDAMSRLSGIRARTLVTAGERDIQVPPRYGVEVAARIPGAKFHLFQGPRASHVSCFEMADEFNELTLSFLRGAG